jgi:hypothetical protein
VSDEKEKTMSRASTRTTICLALATAAVWGPAAGAGTTPTWRHALEVRSTGLNREYHLGRFAVPASAATNAKPAWLRALEIRGRALNHHYRLGMYATPQRQVDVRTYAAVGALAAALSVGAALVLRATRRPAARVPGSA